MGRLIATQFLTFLELLNGYSKVKEAPKGDVDCSFIQAEKCIIQAE